MIAVGEQTAKKIENAILESFKDIPFMKVNILRDFVSSSFYRPDLVLQVDVSSDSERWIVCEIKNNGQPRLARTAIAQLLRYVEAFPQAYPVFAAPYISPRSAEVCREQGVGYVDLAGNCRLTFDNVYILKEGRENPFKEKRDLRSLFSPKAERILRVLLSNPNAKWKTEELAKTAEVSLGQVSNVKKLLADREWIDASDFGLKEPGRLLEAWSTGYRSQRNRRMDYYSFLNVDELETAIALLCRDLGIRYALTGFSAAARRTPMVRYQRAAVYIAENVERLVEGLVLKTVTSGANLSILTPYDNGVFFGAEEIDGIMLVSPVQNYLDLKDDRGRGEEAATALLEGVIEKRW